MYLHAAICDERRCRRDRARVGEEVVARCRVGLRGFVGRLEIEEVAEQAVVRVEEVIDEAA
jgi:hypothetical protein